MRMVMAIKFIYSFHIYSQHVKSLQTPKAALPRLDNTASVFI